MDEKMIRKDRLRFTKNTFSSSMALIAILCNVLFFVSVYKSDVGNYYYTWLTGVSIIYNLLFMMTVFLCSEGVKSYKTGYSVALLCVGVAQFVRTRIIPLKASQAVITLSGEERAVLEAGQYRFQVIMLVVSGILCIVAGAVGIAKSTALHNYEKELAAKKAA